MVLIFRRETWNSVDSLCSTARFWCSLLWDPRRDWNRPRLCCARVRRVVLQLLKSDLTIHSRSQHTHAQTEGQSSSPLARHQETLCSTPWNPSSLKDQQTTGFIITRGTAKTWKRRAVEKGTTLIWHRVGPVLSDLLQLIKSFQCFFFPP